MERLQLRSETSALELTIVNYQFPSTAEYDDVEWLVAELVVAHGDDTFSRRDPALETNDLERIEAFLRKGAEHADIFLEWQSPPLSSRLEFTEPNLGLELRSGPNMLVRVHLSYEFLPPFAGDLQHSRWSPVGGPKKAHEEIYSAWLDFPITASHLRQLADVVAVWRAAFPARRTLGPRFGYPGGVRYNSGMFRANITQSTLTPEMSAYLDALATRAKAGKSAAEAPPAHTARVAPAAPEPAPKGRSRKARGDVSTSEGRRPALNLIGSYDPVDQSAIIAADDVIAFVAPSYVTRTPIRYDELCRLLYRLAGSGESVECLANAFGLGEDDVTRAVALWKRHLGRRKSNA